MRKVFLDDLPRWEKGTNKGKINWKESADRKMRVKFIYDNIEGELEILGYVKKNERERRVLLLKYNDEEGYIGSDSLLKCKIGTLIVSRHGHKTEVFEIYNKLKTNAMGIVWHDIKIGETLKTNHEIYGYNEFKILEYNHQKSTLYFENNGIKCIPIKTNGFIRGKIGGLITKYDSYKSTDFEIYNKLKMNGYGFIWDNIEVGEILKTNHKKYGYCEFEFIKYELKGQKLHLKHNGVKCKPISSGSFVRGQIGVLVGEITQGFKIEVGEQISDKKRDLTILSREYKRDKGGKEWKWYKYKCNRCGWNNGWVTEYSLLVGTGCSCCCAQPKTAVLGINTIWDTDRWMCGLGMSEEDAKKYTKSSARKIEIECACCGRKKMVSISNICSDKSIGCICGLGFSYNEKIMYSVMIQLGLEFQTQLSRSTFEWCGKYKYDFYIPSINTIIETHGEQHYKIKSRGRSLKEEQSNDKHKKQLAKDNGITKYIVIDCRYSDVIYIKENILKSELSELFNLSNIDWGKCEEFAIKKSLVKEVCEYWNKKEEFQSVIHLVKEFHLSKTTIIRYLKRGTSLKWCNYDPKEEMKKVRRDL